MIYFLAGNYFPNNTGGTIIRKRQVDLLKEQKLPVTVITPSTYDAEEDGIIRIEWKRMKFEHIFERFGILEDYMDLWALKTFKFLLNRIVTGDVIIATSGGELAMLKIAAKIKKHHPSLKIIASMHDPLAWSHLDDLHFNDKFHVDRKQTLAKYLGYFDAVITSTKKYSDYLKRTYPSVAEKVICDYFGYVRKTTVCNEIPGIPRIIYGGNLGPIQSPEILTEAAEGENCEIHYLGDVNKNSILKNLSMDNVYITEQKTYDEYLIYCRNYINAGFVSLKGSYFGYCLPSKIFEYINLCLPIIAAIPDGDAKDIINNNGYGIAVAYEDIQSLKEAIRTMSNEDFRNGCRKRILRDRDNWEMKIDAIMDVLN